MTKLLPDPARFYQALRRLVRQEVTPLLDQLERDNMPVRWQGAWVSGRRCRRRSRQAGRQCLDRAARDHRDAGHGFDGRLGNLRRRASALSRGTATGRRSRRRHSTPRARAHRAAGRYGDDQGGRGTSIFDIEALAYSGLHRDMTYRLRRITPPAVPVATFEEACAHLRLGDPTDTPALEPKPLVDRLVKAAAAEIERYCDRSLMSQEWLLSGHVHLTVVALLCELARLSGLAPAQAAVGSPSPASMSTTPRWRPSYGTVIDERLPALIYGKPELPMSQSGYPDAIKIRWLAGIDNADDLPAELVQAALMMVATWYENPAGASPCQLEALPDVASWTPSTIGAWRIRRGDPVLLSRRPSFPPGNSIGSSPCGAPDPGQDSYGQPLTTYPDVAKVWGGYSPSTLREMSPRAKPKARSMPPS